MPGWERFSGVFSGAKVWDRRCGVVQRNWLGRGQHDLNHAVRHERGHTARPGDSRWIFRWSWGRCSVAGRSSVSTRAGGGWWIAASVAGWLLGWLSLWRYMLYVGQVLLGLVVGIIGSLALISLRQNPAQALGSEKTDNHWMLEAARSPDGSVAQLLWSREDRTIASAFEDVGPSPGRDRRCKMQGGGEPHGRGTAWPRI